MPGFAVVDLLVAATAYVLLLPVELPDKTFVATLVLSTRYPALPVWIGVSAAFLVQATIAVTAGGLLALLPRTPVLVAAATLFLIGSVVLFRSARSAGDEAAEEAEEAEEEQEVAERAPAQATGARAAGASFVVLFLAEWGDLSQLLTAGLAARYGDPVSVLAGAWLALVTIAGLAVVLGRALLRRIRLPTIRRTAAGICLVLAVLTSLEAAGAI
jgi:Ca2+/H+ antiporter, TMEM165/GDT1 family